MSTALFSAPAGGSWPSTAESVTYFSQGRTLVLGPAGVVQRAADLLGQALTTTLWVESPKGSQGAAATGGGRWRTLTGRLVQLQGYLGAFELQYEALSSEIPALQRETFDLVLDLRPKAAFDQAVLPMGYVFSPAEAATATADARAMGLADAVRRLRSWEGVFDKPKFFDYQPNLCAHSRNGIVGCRACIDVCSAAAIRSDVRAQQVVVDPHLCVGCGTCSSVCPSGAMQFVYPRVAVLGEKLQAMLAQRAQAGQMDSIVLLHGHAATPMRLTPRAASRLLPVLLWHAASAGLDLWLSAIAYGASQVWVQVSAVDDAVYVAALRGQLTVAQALLNGLGYAGQHFQLLPADEREAAAMVSASLDKGPQRVVRKRASYAVQADKRATLELALAHLIAQAPGELPPALTLPAAGSPFGTLEVNTEACTLCLGCVGACPSNALAGSADGLQLRFLERACVQCGLCVNTCPEKALRLVPRLNLASARQQAQALVSAQAYRCVRCGSAFSSQKAVELMLGKLASHPMFQGAALERLKMCGDCRLLPLPAR